MTKNCTIVRLVLSPGYSIKTDFHIEGWLIEFYPKIMLSEDVPIRDSLYCTFYYIGFKIHNGLKVFPQKNLI